MQQIIFLKGLPASGKSTYARELVSSEPNKYKRINKDEIRSMLDNGRHSNPNETFVLEVRDFLIKSTLEKGMIPIVDDTNLHPKHLETISKNHPEAIIETKFFDVPVFECIERDLKRPNSVGGRVILSMWKQFLQKKIDENESLPRAIICDIDGTIADMGNRHPFDWKSVGNDAPKKPVIDLLKRLSRYQDEFVSIILVSGRSSVCKDETVNWINKNEVPFKKIYMRSEGDNRDDAIVKREIYESCIKGKFNVDFVLDDRNKVVDMWRSLGLTCLQVDYGNF